jgi:hypothetical protein
MSSEHTRVRDSGTAIWVIPYVDQPIAFWEDIADAFGAFIREVYMPLPGKLIGSGRPSQPDTHLKPFLRRARLPFSVLLNPITLPQPAENLAPRIIEALRRLMGEFGLAGATVSDLTLAARLHETLPDLPLTASAVMDIAYPNQTIMLEGLCDTLVPATRVMRDLPALRALRGAFSGRIRIIVNEGCLPNCPFRVQHFHEMASGFSRPQSPCQDMLRRHPWMRMTGAWVLPQHLHLYAWVYDELKIAGRATLRTRRDYVRVLDAYVHGRPLPPNAIGAGPASVLEPLEITESFFALTLSCGHQCHRCTLCREAYDQARSRCPDLAPSQATGGARGTPGSTGERG